MRMFVDMTHVTTTGTECVKKGKRILQVNAKTWRICFVLHNPVGVTFVCINFSFDPLRITPSALGMPEHQSQLPTTTQHKQIQKQKYTYNTI